MFDHLFAQTNNKHEIYAAKGPVFATAIVCGVMAAKKTSDIIPFCHPVMIEKCDIDIALDDIVPGCIRIDCHVTTSHKTGVEMEALVGATSASLCVYDMLKALSKDIRISDVRLISKTGGKSDFLR